MIKIRIAFIFSLKVVHTIKAVQKTEFLNLAKRLIIVNQRQMRFVSSYGHFPCNDRNLDERGAVSHVGYVI